MSTHNLVARKRVLVVEDEPILRHVLSRMLAGPDREVVVATDGQEAWELFQRGGIDLVLSDIDMPKLNGVELYKLVREQCAATPFVFLSAFDTGVDFTDVNQLPVSETLAKPFSRMTVTRTVAELLEPNGRV